MSSKIKCNLILWSALVGLELLSGCTLRVDAYLYNDTGGVIAVTEGSKKIVIQEGGFARAFLVADKKAPQNSGLLVQGKSNDFFYPLVKNHIDVLQSPRFLEQNGLYGRRFNYCLDSSMRLYVLDPLSKGLSSNRDNQPPGFPLEPVRIRSAG